jgi:D-3-phosphoglycerate dehydrogenase
MKKILFVDTVHPVLEERLIHLGYVCEHDLKSSKEEIESKIDQYFGLVIRSRFPINESFLNKANTLKFIARSGAGLENINVALAEEMGVTVFNSPEGNMDAVGEHSIGMLLMLFNQLKKGDLEVREGLWDREGNRGLELAKKTVGIIGYGNMGKAFSEKLSGFGCRVIAYDKYKEDFQSEAVEEVSLEEVFQETDVLSIHLPLSEETHHYVNKEFLSKFKKPIYIVNTARGNNVCVADLVSGLKHNIVLGACLDVLEYETKSFETISALELPEDFKYLSQSDRVILSPHVAGWTEESYIKLSSFLAAKIENKFN